MQPGSDVAVVVGSEEKGIRPGILSKCDETVLISNKSGEVGLESLNVSVATGILCAYYKGVLSKK
jgi:tRNA G18 (ribose-2'-O)-methylase SpoU